MNIAFSHLPDSLDAFYRMLNDYPLQSPDNVCALFLCALHLYIKDREAGEKAVDLLRGPRTMNGFDRSFLKDRLRGKEYLPDSYFSGASPQNNYQPSLPYTITILKDERWREVEEGFVRKYLITAGADSPRPLKLRIRQSTGEWFLWEYSSILTGIRIPDSKDPWQ